MNLEENIIKILQNSENTIIEVQKQFKAPREKKIIKIKPENTTYKTINIEKFIPYIDPLVDKIESYRYAFSEANREVMQNLHELKKISTYVKKQNNIFGNLYDENEIKLDKKDLHKTNTLVNKTLNKIVDTKNNILNLETNLNLISQLQTTKIHISNEQVEETLIKTLNKEINRSRARKIILKKPITKKPAIIQKIIKKTPKIIIPYKPTQYDKEEIDFLKTRGIKGRKAKNLIELPNYKEIKQFINCIENIFETHGYRKQEATPLFKKSAILKENFQEYKYALEDLLDAYNGVRGILPKYRKKRFTTAKKIRSLISEDKPKVYIEGLTIIENRKDRDNIEKQLLENPFNTGRRIMKFSKIVRASFYDSCATSRGHEGHYRREGFGRRRALFEVSRNEDKTLTVEIFKYFTNHNDYEAFYK